MKLFGIISVLAATGWLAWSVERRLRQRPFPMTWRVAAVVLIITGLSLGVWLITREHHVSPTVRLAGYPFAVAGYEFIEGRWLGGLVSRFVLLAFLADIAAGVGICLLPLRIAQFIFERRVSHESANNAA